MLFIQLAAAARARYCMCYCARQLPARCWAVDAHGAEVALYRCPGRHDIMFKRIVANLILLLYAAEIVCCRRLHQAPGQAKDACATSAVVFQNAQDIVTASNIQISGSSLCMRAAEGAACVLAPPRATFEAATFTSRNLRCRLSVSGAMSAAPTYHIREICPF
jgi:hypothetical protein